jgi:hypothetical protein
MRGALVSNLPNPYFHSPMNRYPTPAPPDPLAWTTAPENEEPGQPSKPRRSRAKIAALVVSICALVAAATVALIALT